MRIGPGGDSGGTLKTWQTGATYGPDGLRRIAKVTDITNGSTWLSTTLSVLDGQSVVQEVVDKPGTSNDETVTYLTGAVGPTYRRGGNGVKTWYAYDGLGSVLGEVSSSTGNLSKSRVYDVYGTVQAEDAATSASNRKFVGGLGHPSEGETGLIYMRARYMDPAVGRFVSEDPQGSGVNWFVYCDNDPVNKVDRDGRIAIPAAFMAGLVQGLISGYVNYLKGKEFSAGFAGGFVTGFMSFSIPGSFVIAPDAGSAVTAALNGQDFSGIMKAAGIGAASTIFARIAITTLLAEESDEVLQAARPLLGIIGKNAGDAAVSAWDFIK